MASHPNKLVKHDDSAHPVVQDAIDKGYMASGANYYVQGLRDHATANQARLSVGRALTFFGLSRTAWVTDADGTPCYKACQDAAAPHGVGFRLISRDAGRRYVAEQSGGDPSKLKYNPYMPRRRPRFNDDGSWNPGR